MFEEITDKIEKDIEQLKGYEIHGGKNLDEFREFILEYKNYIEKFQKNIASQIFKINNEKAFKLLPWLNDYFEKLIKDLEAWGLLILLTPSKTPSDLIKSVSTFIMNETRDINMYIQLFKSI